jgi:hypothetical protein
MKKPPHIFRMLAMCLFLAPILSYGQSVGVGTNNPNPFAILDITAPNKNQGMLMPRLTTAERTALGTSILASASPNASNSLLVYDTNLQGYFYWDSGVWSSLTGGTNAYVYVGYAQDNAGAGFSASPASSLDFISFVTTTSPTAPTVAAFNAAGWKQYRGPQGPKGTGILSNTSNPIAAIGNDGEFFINTTTNTLFGPKASGAWPTTGVSLIGPKGSSVLNSNTNPIASVGNDGDFFINTTTNTLFGPKASSAWPATGVSLIGPKGSSVLGANTNPIASVGNDGDFFINTTTNTLFGPKASGAWPATGVSLIGPKGSSVLNSNTNPIASVGNDGDFFINTTTNTLFGPKASSAWPSTGVSLVGPKGSSVLSANTNPIASAGNDGDFFINTTTNTLFGPKTSGTWPSAGVSLIGPKGSSVLSANTNPIASVGNDGDFFINTATSTIFGPKTSGAWPSTGVSLIGPAGANGFSVLSGTSNPTSSLGVNGDLFINIATGTIFGPKTSGAWPSTGVSLIGPKGSSVLSANTNPIASVGNDGDFFINTATSTIFGPKTGGVWPAGVSLVGSYTAGTGIGISGNVISNTGDNDNDATNELISSTTLTGKNLTIAQGSNTKTVDLSSLSTVYTAGTGIGISGNVITNTGDNDPANELISSAILSGKNLTISQGANSKTVDLSSISGIGGTISPDFIPKMNNAGTALQNSVIFQNNTTGNVGIGTNSPTNTLDVKGGVAIGGVFAGSSAAPANGLIVEGNTGLGALNTYNDRLYVKHTLNNPGSGIRSETTSSAPNVNPSINGQISGSGKGQYFGLLGNSDLTNTADPAAKAIGVGSVVGGSGDGSLKGFDAQVTGTGFGDKIGAELIVSGTGGTNTGLHVVVKGGSTNYAAIFEAGNQSEGFVGIGTNAPAYMLDVAGTIRSGWSGGSLPPIPGKLILTAGNFDFTIKPSASPTTNVVWTLPPNNGAAGNVLSTNGTGTLFWTTPASGSGLASATNGLTAAGTTAKLGGPLIEDTWVDAKNFKMSFQKDEVNAQSTPLRILNAAPAANGQGSRLAFTANASVGVNEMGAVGARFTDANATTAKGVLTFETRLGANIRETMRLDELGHLGIGTPDPSSHLQVNGNIANTLLQEGVYADISNQNSTLNTHAGLRFSTHYDGSTLQAVYKAGIFYRRKGARGIGDLIFSTNTDVGTNTSVDATDSYAKMILTSQGLLGVGTTTPDRYLELEGANDQFMRVTTTTSGIAGIELKRGGGADYRIQANSGLLQFRYGDVDGATTALYNFSDLAFAPGATALNLSLGGPSFRWKDLYLSGYTLNAANITPTTDNASDLGTSTLRFKDIYATNAVIQTSDLRLKKNVKALPYGLQEVLQLRPVTFEWKNSKDESTKLGLIAQEIQTLIPEVVNVGNDEQQMLGVKYADLIPVLIKAIQEQNKMIADQKKENGELKAALEKLETQNTNMQADLEQIKKIIGLEAKKKP